MTLNFAGSSPIRILMAEDNPDDVELTLEALEEVKLALNIHTVKDGVEAIQYLRNEPPFEDAGRPDLILLDLNMPRKDGREVLEEIKHDPHLKHIPVVVLTTSQDDSDIMSAYENHANCYVTKPVDLDQFIKVVKSIESFWLSVVKLPGKND